MIQRAVRATAAKGMFDEAQRLLLKLLEIAPDDANYSRTKWRFAAELVKTAVVQQKRAVATAIASLAESKIDRAHLTSAEIEGVWIVPGALNDVEKSCPPDTVEM